MTAAAETGRAGERAATEYLRRAGYEICALNWRQGRYELDIVALRDGVLHFVEVKTRREGSLTPPEAAATQRKFRWAGRAKCSSIWRPPKPPPTAPSASN